MAILEVRNLTHTYSGNSPFMNDAVKDVSFTVEKGEIIGIIGHTGSGKSTLVQHLNGLLKPTEGNVLFENEDIWENPKEIRKIRSKVGLVFQYPEYQLFEETVFKDISFGPRNMGLESEALENTVKEICGIVGVKPEFFEKSPFDLSGGEKRRVAIAGVMAMKPQVIVFDEPTAGLDPKGREDVMEIIRSYRKATNATVIIISHSMEDMAALADKVIVMNKGSLYMFGTAREVFSHSDELRKIGLNVPIVSQVFEALGLNNIPLTVDEAVEILKKRVGDNA
ncbi:MAG: energy-coupling factor transporter ATPase [Clostridia bacterium]|nr:energy-coupling factor transporter ATPase [Clostridia bacterium]